MFSSSCQYKTQEALVSTGDKGNNTIVHRPPKKKKKSQVISANRLKTYFPSLVIKYDKLKDFQNKNVREALIVKTGFLAKLLHFFPSAQ